MKAMTRHAGNVVRTATLSRCGTYRYRLGRLWNPLSARLMFVMLNPSKADAYEDDPTIRRCIGFARSHQFGGIEVVNLYAYRTPHPRDLKAAGYPVGPKNDDYIADALGDCAAVCVAWGSNARGLARPAEVLRLLRRHGVAPKALGLDANGIPRHPLMLPKTSRLAPYEAGANVRVKRLPPRIARL